VGGMGETNKSQNVSQNNEGNENETSMHKWPRKKQSSF
jgi:hypothetical protein